MTEQPVPTGNRRLVIIVAIAVLVLVVGVVGTVIANGGGDDHHPTTRPSTTPTASCDPVVTKPTDHNQEHVNPPTPLHYGDAPPAFGAHRPVPVSFGRPFYGADRPEVGNLVHSMEHGYTIAWYDDTAAADHDAMIRLERIATDYQAAHERFIAAPWHSSDGAAFPDGRHIALTRWSAAASNPADETLQRGNWMYCTGVNQRSISTFFDTWPNAQSPEVNLY